MLTQEKTEWVLPILNPIPGIPLAPASPTSVLEEMRYSVVRFTTSTNRVSMKKILFSLAAGTLIFLPSAVLAATLTNPLGTTNIRTVIGRLITSLLGVTGSIALLMFVYGGFLWLISAGVPDKVKKGKEVMKWAVLGLVVIVGAYTIVRAVVTALESGTI